MAIGTKGKQTSDAEDLDNDPPGVGGGKGGAGETTFNFDFTSVPELAPAPEGVYQVSIEKVEHKKSKSSDAEYFNVIASIVDEPNVPDIFWMISTPIASDTSKQKAGKMNRLKAFLAALGRDPQEGFKPSDLVGAKCWVKVKQSFDQKGELRNEIVGVEADPEDPTT